MYAHTRQWHTKKSTYSEWTQWDEAKSGRLNLWAAPMIVQLQEATQYYYYRAVLAIFPLTPDQIRAQPRACDCGLQTITSDISEIPKLPSAAWSLDMIAIYTVNQKRIPGIIDCNLKKDDQILIVFGKNIPDTTGRHPMTVEVPTSPSVCSCTTFYFLQVTTDNVGCFWHFLFILVLILYVPFSPGSAETHIGWGGNLNGRLVASCVRNICTKNY